MAVYRKEAFDISRDFEQSWNDFMAMKPERTGKAEWIREAIRNYVERQKAKQKRSKRVGRA